MKKLSNIAKNIFFGIRICFLSSKGYFLLKTLILLSTTLLPLYNIGLWREILNCITEQSEKTVLWSLSTYLAINLIIYILEKLDSFVNDRYGDELQCYIENIMIDKTSRMDLSFFDSSKMADRVRYTRSTFNVVNEMTWLVFTIISEVFNIIAVFIIVFMYKWWIAGAVILLEIPYLIYNKKYTEKRLSMEKEQVTNNRKRDYFAQMPFNNEIQFEIKLNKIGKYIVDSFHSIWKKIMPLIKRLMYVMLLWVL